VLSINAKSVKGSRKGAGTQRGRRSQEEANLLENRRKEKPNLRNTMTANGWGLGKVKKGEKGFGAKKISCGWLLTEIIGESVP